MHTRIERLRRAGPGRLPALGIVALMACASTAASFAQTTAAAAAPTKQAPSPTWRWNVLNLTRVESFGSPFVNWIRVTVDPSDPALFRVAPGAQQF